MGIYKRYTAISKFYTGCLLLLSGSVFGQLSGDVNGDNLIGVKDYNLVKEAILNDQSLNNRADVNKDGYLNVADLIVLENYIYRDGRSLPAVFDEKTQPQLSVALGPVNSKDRILSVYFTSTESISGIEFRVPGASFSNAVEGAIHKAGMVIEIRGDRIICYRGEGAAVLLSSGILLDLKYEKLPARDLCIAEPVASSSIGQQMRTVVGECITTQLSSNGIAKIKEDYKEGKTDMPDVNFDGKKNVADVLVLEDFKNDPLKYPLGKQVKNARRKPRVHVSVVDGKGLVEVTFPEPMRGLELDFNQMPDGLKETIGGSWGLSRNGSKALILGGEGEQLGPGNLALLQFDLMDSTYNVCVKHVYGLTKSQSVVDLEKPVCLQLTKSVPGCTDKKAVNYDPGATVDNGTCEYEGKEVAIKEPKQPKEEKEKEERVEEVKMEEEKVEVPVESIKTSVSIRSVSAHELSTLSGMKKGDVLYVKDRKTLVQYNGKKWITISTEVELE